MNKKNFIIILFLIGQVMLVHPVIKDPHATDSGNSKIVPDLSSSSESSKSIPAFIFKEACSDLADFVTLNPIKLGWKFFKLYMLNLAARIPVWFVNKHIFPMDNQGKHNCRLGFLGAVYITAKLKKYK